MTRYTSTPSLNRRLLAAACFVALALIASLIRLARPDFKLTPILLPLDFNGTSPNFFVCAAGPLLAFTSRKSVPLGDHIKAAFGTALGLTLYELAQFYMPRRTFDLNDIFASFLGALLSILLAPLFFRKQPPRSLV